jgi:hypothetical protein
MKTLTLEHLSAYLPYHAIVQWTRPDDKAVLFSPLTVADYYFYIHRNKAKIILYPLSSLTETIWFEGKEINPSEFIKDWYNEKYAKSIDGLEHYSFKNDFILFGTIEPTEETEVNNMPYQAYQLLFKMKIDVFSLIEKGLAVDVNSLETNPYKL